MAKDDTYSYNYPEMSSPTYNVENPGTLEILGLQRDDIVINDDMYGATKNTLYQYQNNPDDSISSYLVDGIRVTANNTFLVNGYSTTLHLAGDRVVSDIREISPSLITKTNISSDPNIIEEKRRISLQKSSINPDTKDGFFALGTVYLNIPPSQINITDEAMNFKYSGLRQPGEVVASSGRSTTRIDLEIVFNGLEDINNKLRPLMAQLKTVPFIQIENEYVRAVMNPSDLLLKDLSYAEALKQQAELAKKANDQLNSLIELSEKKKKVDDEILDLVSKMHKDGSISDEWWVKLSTGSYLTNPNNIPPDELTYEDWTIDKNDAPKVDLSKFLSRIVTVQGESQNIFTEQSSLREIRALQEKSEDIGYQQRALGFDRTEQRFKYRSIIGVLSQMSISTIPGFPETLSCRLSLYAFNYDPFSVDFGYISGYNKGAFTTDVTKCDLFIDWYTTRWLKPQNDVKKPGLGRYTTNQGLKFTYATKIRPVSADYKNRNVIVEDYAESESFATGSDLHVVGISATLSNAIQFLPILSCKSPTCQYLGNINSSVKLVLESTNIDSVKKICKMIEKIRKLPREENRISRNSFINIENDMLSFMAMKFFSIDDFSVDTVPGNPGLYSINIDLLEYKLGLQEFQSLKREGITTNDDILSAAEFIIKAANRYSVNRESSFRTYYNDVLDKDYGWFNKNNNIVSSYVLGGANNELKKKIDSKISSVSLSNRFGSVISRTESAMNLLISGAPLASIIGGTSIAGGFGYDSYGDAFANSLKNDPENINSFWMDNLPIITELVADAKREEIISMLTTNMNDNPALVEWVNSRNGQKEDKDKAIVKEYCYPDLDLPRYVDIPNGSSFINTKKEAGVPRNPKEDNEPAQTEYSEVDPDFFYFKGSIWKIADQNSDTETAGGVNRAIDVYKTLASSNYNYRKSPKAMDEEQLANYLAQREKFLVKNRGFDLQPVDFKLNLEELKKIEGKNLKVVGISDGGTIQVSDGTNTYSAKIPGYIASTKTGSKEYIRQRSALAGLLMNKDGSMKNVRFYFGGSKVDDKGNLTPNILVESGGGYENLSNLMIGKQEELGLLKITNPENPNSLEYENRFLRAHESYVKAITSGEEKSVANYSKSIFGYSLGNLVTSAINRISTDWEHAQSSVADDLGVLVGSEVKKIVTLGKFLSPFSVSGFFGLGATAARMLRDYDGFTNEITNDIDAMVKSITKPTNVKGINRFNREGDQEIEDLSRKIRESQKDDTLRMSRAFPTFKIYFIEEDMPEWGRFDDLYSYQSVTSIDITKSRTEAADAAVITFLNTLGTLDRSYFGLHDEINDDTLQQRAPLQAIETNKQETAAEQNLEEFVMKAGTIIKIKMGYSSDPDLLETVFTGVIAEVSGGDVITVVAQGFGVELLTIAPRARYRGSGPFAFSVLNKLISSPEVRHFGKLEWFPASSASRNSFSMRTVYDDTKGEYIQDAWYRRIGGINHVLSIVNNTADDNIWMPLYSQHIWYRLCRGGSWDFITQNKTIWDVFREMQIRMPGYITTVLPFDNRATIYFGPSDFMYWYTNQKKDKIRDWNIAYKEKKTSAEKLDSLFSDSGFSQSSPQEVNSSFNRLGDYLTKLYNSDYKDNKKYQARILSLVDSINNNSNLFDMNSGDNVSFCKTIAQSGLSNSSSDAEIKSRLEDVARLLPIRSDNGLRASNRNGRINIEYVGENDLIKSKDGSFMTTKDAINYYDRSKSELRESLNPSRKLVRNYHFKDSFHHIIGNTIVATDENLYNRVVVEYGNEAEWNSGKMSTSVAKHHTVTAQVDTEMWPEKVKTKIVNERNARDPWTAWNYAQGHLSEEMRKMYGGHLIVYGDPTIKPYDILMIADYFTEMFGPVEVEQVNHHFSSDTGFVTTISPNLVCHANNTLQQGSLTVAGAYMDSLTKQIESIRGDPGLVFTDIMTSIATFGHRPSLRKGVSNLVFWVAGLTDIDRRESISLCPLMYAGRPYVAGIQGFKVRSLYEVVSGRLTQFTRQFSRVKKTIDEISRTIPRALGQNLSQSGQA